MANTRTFSQAFSSKSAYVLRLVVNESGTSIANNTSTVSWELWLDVNGYTAFSDHRATVSVQIGSAAAYSNVFPSFSAGNAQTGTWSSRIASGTAVIPHNSDGTKTVTCTASMSVAASDYSPGSASISQSWALTTIPRASTVSASGGVIGSPITIAISRKSTAFTHSVYWTIGATRTLIATGVGTSCTWTPDMTTIAGMILTTVTSITCAITCETYNGSTLIGTNICYITLTVPESARPQVSAGWFTASKANVGGAAGIDAWVQGMSKVRITFDPSKIVNVYNATTAAYGVTVEGSTTSSASTTQTSQVLTQEGTILYTVWVQDSRGRRTSETGTVTLLPYSAPAISGVNVFRCDALGVENDEGAYISAAATANVSDIGGLNTGTMRVRWKEQGGSWEAYTAMVSGTAVLLGGGLLLESKTYVAEISLTDTVGNTAVNESIVPTAAVVLHLKAGGKGAAFFGYSVTDGELTVFGNIAADNLADTVVEEATDGDWTYQTYASGIVRAFGHINAENVTLTQIGSTGIYYGSCTVSLPVSLTSMVVTGSSRYSTGHCLPVTFVPYSTGDTVTVYIYDFYARSGTFRLALNVVGMI